MRTIRVDASKSYDVVIGSGLLPSLGERLLPLLGPCRCALVTDDLVDRLYADPVTASLEASGYQVCKFVFPNGEASKNADTYISLLEFLAKEQLTRGDLIAALGGGVVGDLAGFAAASYLRGIRFVQFPTTLLAAVDSSVGGKTGIDLRAGKNLAGAFHQPELVLCDYDCLETLPKERFADGIAEAVKCGIIRSESLFSLLSSGFSAEHTEELISECVRIKRDVVAEDEFESGSRQLLNLGHTVGHGIEALSGFRITHGHAVSAGTVIAAKMAFQLGLCEKETVERIGETLRKNQLPVSTEQSAEALYLAALSDKKRRGDSISLVLPKRIGECVVYPMKLPAFKELLSEAMNPSFR